MNRLAIHAMPHEKYVVHEIVILALKELLDLKSESRS